MVNIELLVYNGTSDRVATSQDDKNSLTFPWIFTDQETISTDHTAVEDKFFANKLKQNSLTVYLEKKKNNNNNIKKKKKKRKKRNCFSLTSPDRGNPIRWYDLIVVTDLIIPWRKSRRFIVVSILAFKTPFLNEWICINCSIVHVELCSSRPEP